MLFGGAWHHVQSFNAAANQASSSLLLLSCIGIILPTAATQLSAPGDVSQAELLAISRATALILLIV
jgi:Ca2+:H+ antiporter